MRVAIFSDVHGNLTALEAVLADIKQHAPDLTVFAGDLCFHGPRPSDCIERLRGEQIACLYGNTDMAVRDPAILSRQISAVEERRRQHIENLVEWTWTRLSELDRAWLRSLPFQRSVAPSANPRDDLLIVHANPIDTEQSIHPPEDLQRSLYGEVRQKDEELRDLLRDKIIAVLAFGHVHVPSVRHWGDIVLANISSTSLSLDGDPRAKYGLLTWDGAAGWSVEHQYVEYDLEKEIALLEQLRPPEWEQICSWLRTGREEE